MTWRSSSRSKISPLHVTYVSIPSMSICFSCFTNCSTCSWLYGPKPPAPLPVEAAGPAEADPATPAGPVPPLLPVEAAGPTEVDPAAAGPVPVLPVEAAGGLLAARGRVRGPGGRGLGAGTRLRHTRDTRERFANALATIPGQRLDPWTPTFKTGTLLLRIREKHCKQ